MNIKYEFVAYAGPVFTNENGIVDSFSDIKDNFYKLFGRKGKIIYKGYINFYEQGYVGTFDNYGFVFQDDLSTAILPSKIILHQS